MVVPTILGASLVVTLQAAAPIAVEGQGPVKVVMETPADLPGFTVYRPAQPAKVTGKLPVLAFGNGGCINQGNRSQALLGEIASHGYLVVAIGPIGVLEARVEQPGVAGETPQDALARRVATSGPAPTRVDQLWQAIDWAEKANRVGPLKGRLAADRIAVAGHSCGGLQAIAASSDKRVDTTIVLNSGVFEQPRVRVDKAALAALPGPALYIIGGPGDIAYANAEDDFRRIAHVPVFKANSDFGHGGKLYDRYGGPSAKWIVRWLDWTLKGDTAARLDFAGPNCTLCRERGWTSERKKLD